MGRPWTGSAVYGLLKNEKYIGNMLWNRSSKKLHGPFVKNPPARWVRADGAFEPIVDTETFAAAQARLNRNNSKIDADQALTDISRLLHESGRLSLKDIRERLDIPGKSRVRRLIPSLSDMYRQVGYCPAFDMTYVDQRIVAKRAMAEHLAELTSKLEAAGHVVEHDSSFSMLCIDHGLRVKVTVTLGHKEINCLPYAMATRSRRHPADLLLIGLFPRPLLVLQCFYLLPETLLGDSDELMLSPSRVPGVEAFRTTDLSVLLTLCARATIEACHGSSDRNDYR